MKLTQMLGEIKIIQNRIEAYLSSNPYNENSPYINFKIGVHKFRGVVINDKEILISFIDTNNTSNKRKTFFLNYIKQNNLEQFCKEHNGNSAFRLSKLIFDIKEQN